MKGSYVRRGTAINPDAPVGKMLDGKKIPVELRSIKPPKEKAIDPLILDCITTEVHHSRVIMDYSISLYASLPAWITDYFEHNETRSYTKRNGKIVILRLFVQLTTDETKFAEMIKNVDFKKISERQRYILVKLFKPFDKFPVIDFYRYDPNGSSTMSRPKRVGYFSIVIRSQRPVFCSDKSQLRYFYPPTNVNALLDLKRGFKRNVSWCRAPSERHIVQWYWEHGASMHGIDTAPNIITNLRTLATIMSSPTNNLDNWEIVAGVFTGQIFMYEIDTHQRSKRVHNQDQYQNLSSYAGYRFEQYVTRRFNGQNCKLYDGGLRDSFHTVNTANIGKHKILYNCRCVAANDKENMFTLIDEMDIIDIKSRANKNSWESRVASLWVRAMLNRVSQIYIGEKSPEFIVSNITSISTDRLLPKSYNRGALFNFLHKTLDFITDTCKEEKGVYRFHRTPFLPVIVQKMDMPIESVLPRWYVSGETPPSP